MISTQAENWGYGRAWLFSRATRAVAGDLVIWTDVADARRLLGRPPAIDGGQHVAWDGVTRAELERLLLAKDPIDPAASLAELDVLPFELGPCSLCYPGNR